ncbi:MAG: aldose 1-epimerase [Thermomicrobiales bacterium]|nr:aldose 1-epimerase [Thermomicrobiales bacterium]
MSTCFAEEIALPQGISAYRFGNDNVMMTVLPEKGNDIHEWVHRRTGIDVLWKSPWGLRRHRGNTTSSVSTMVAWMDAYQGGWQVLFPSGGGPSQYRGVELNFHGEASAVAWDVEEFGASTDGAGIRTSTRLARSPFRLTRTMTLSPGASHVVIEETITNDAGEEIDYVWGHHPAYGAPFIGPDTIIDTNAATVTVDERLTGTTSLLEAGATFPWPTATQHGQAVDLRTIPAEGAGVANMAYIHDFPGDVAWYGFTNVKRGFGAGLAWRTEDFPCAWFWQELNGSSGYPWYKGEYVLAIEPNTSFPGHGLAAVIEKGTARSLAPGESASMTMTAVMYESTTGVAGIGLDGQVEVRKERS